MIITEPGLPSRQLLSRQQPHLSDARNIELWPSTKLWSNSQVRELQSSQERQHKADQVESAQLDTAPDSVASIPISKPAHLDNRLRPTGDQDVVVILDMMSRAK